MTMLAGAVLAALLLAPQGEAWTWTLYEDEGPLVLANEVPDTPRLRSTFECEPGSGVARLAVYDGAGADGFATVSAGAAAATVQTSAGRNGRLETAVRVDHPVFAAFSAGGALTVTVGEARRSIEVPPAHLAKLRRFAERCAG